MTTDENSGLTRAEIVHVCGDLVDAQIQAILQTGASLGELEQAAAYASGANDIMGDERKPLTGPVAQVYEILTRDEDWEDDSPL